MGDMAFNGITPQPIGANLTADMFYFRRNIPQLEEGAHHLEHNLIDYMPQIVTSSSPQLLAAADYHPDRVRPHLSHYRERACL